MCFRDKTDTQTVTVTVEDTGRVMLAMGVTKLTRIPGQDHCSPRPLRSAQILGRGFREWELHGDRLTDVLSEGECK